MKNRTLKGVVIAGLAMAICSNAETCKESVIYDGTLNNGRMEESSRTFPEAPEWQANWGNFENMEAPYIRLSGMKNSQGDWKGNLVFNTFPVTLKGGSLKMSVRATQNAKFGVSLAGNSGNGKTAYYTLAANSTKVIEVPVESLLGSGSGTVNQVGIGLYGVPAWQYTSLFVDNLKFTCTGSPSTGTATAATTGEEDSYQFREVDFSSANREFLTPTVNAPKAAIGTPERESLKQRTQRNFVLDEQEHRQVMEFQKANSPTAQKSRDGWYRSLFIVERNRIKDNAIASPKNIFHEAGEIAAGNGNRDIPLLIADIDYAIKHFTDTTFTGYRLDDFHLLLAGFATSHVRGSKVNIVYDPFFVTTTRQVLPSVEICVNGKCSGVEPGSTLPVEFGSAGLQTITVKLSSENTSVQQNLKLEVK